MLAWIRKLLKPTGGVIELCVGCQQAMLRISHGTQETHCPVCGCRWMGKEAADMYKVQHHEPRVGTLERKEWQEDENRKARARLDAIPIRERK